MEGFPSFFRKDEEWKKLDIDSAALKSIVSKLLTEQSLTLKDIEASSAEPGDYVAVSANRMGTEAKSLVRCREYTAGITEEDVEDLYEDMMNMKAASAVFVTPAHFTKEAKKFAEHVPVQLVDGVMLGKLLAESYAVKAELAFLTAFNDEAAVRYFKQNRGRKFAGVIGKDERIEEIDRRYIPLGHFLVKKVAKEAETTKSIYVDLTSGNILYMEEERIEEDGFFKKILDLPEESQVHLLDLMKYGELRHEHLDGKSLNILEKEKLVAIRDKGSETSMLNILLDEVTDTITLAATEATTLSHAEPRDTKINVDTKKFVKETMVKPLIDASYDLARFMEATREPDTGFTPDPVHYDPQKVGHILDVIYAEEDVSLAEIAYLPYYRCKYVTQYGAVRFKKLFSPKFKGFVPKHGILTGLYRLIDIIPAVPYLIIAAVFVLLNLNNLSYAIHILAVAFIFVSVAVFAGILLKVIFKTERKMPRYGNTIAKYGFPSIHALTSAGAVAFTLFINPVIALALLPLCLLYIYSRLKLGVHTETDVIGGAMVGVVLGLFFGMLVLPTLNLGEFIETVLAVLFFAVSIAVTIIELQFR